MSRKPASERLETPLPETGLFDGLFPEERQQLQSITRRVELPAGMTLFHFREPAVALMVVESGRLALTLPVTIRGETRDVTVEERGPGSVVG